MTVSTRNAWPLPNVWPYAEIPTRRVRQVLGDLAVLMWCVLWWRIAVAVRERVLGLQDAGARAEEAGIAIGDRLRSAGDAVAGVPLAGARLAPPLRSAAEAGAGLADAGRRAQEAVRTTATVVHAVLLVVLVGLVLIGWLWRRARWTAEAVAARRLRATREGLQVLGLRAAATAPLRSVSKVLRPHDEAAGLDRDALEVLGCLELRRLGLRNAEFLA